MLTEQDKDWIESAYPGLLLNDKGVAGEVRFRAAYNRKANLFVIGEPDRTETDYIVLDCDFDIRIEGREVATFSALPALYVEGFEHNPKRHIDRDGSACLCSPFEEREFLSPQFSFRPYFQKLVIPFLYGQAFLSLHQRWPWSEYSHSAAGLLES